MGKTHIEFFRYGYMAILSRRAQRNDPWAVDRLRIVAESMDAIEGGHELKCAGCEAPIKAGSFIEGFAIAQEDGEREGLFLPLCECCAKLEPPDAVRRIGANIGFTLEDDAPVNFIGTGDTREGRRPKTIKEAVEQFERMINGGV
jgi:hypothetical protein